MSSLEELKQARLQKLEKIKALNMDPYPAKVPKDFDLRYLRANFEDLEAKAKEVSVVGRVMAIRGQGAILFVVLDDGTQKFQAVFKKDAFKDKEKFNNFVDVIDIGDFLSVTGKLFVTQRGEESIEVHDWMIAVKSLLPLPEKWHGLVDIDEKLRKRYLDFVMNPELREIFYKKAKFWNATREFLMKNNFLEVETPTLEVTTGGAEATPFKTHHNDYDLDVYLRISVGELWQKRLLSGGFPRTFEIGRVYRNEGSSPNHTQEFTNLEFYMAYSNYEDGIVFTEEMLKYVIKESFGTLDFKDRENGFDLNGEWPRISYVEEIKKVTGIDVLTANEKEIKTKLNNLKVEYDGENIERLTDTLWKYVRKEIVGPVWLIDVPKIVSPLSKSKKDNPLLTERAQLILAGAEVTNGFTELNDPVDQRARFEAQKELLAKGDTEAMMSDDEFVVMLEHGMPPAFGMAYGERLFAILVGKPLREVQTFPLMRPKGE